MDPLSEIGLWVVNAEPLILILIALILTGIAALMAKAGWFDESYPYYQFKRYERSYQRHGPVSKKDKHR